MTMTSDLEALISGGGEHRYVDARPKDTIFTTPPQLRLALRKLQDACNAPKWSEAWPSAVAFLSAAASAVRFQLIDDRVSAGIFGTLALCLLGFCVVNLFKAFAHRCCIKSLWNIRDHRCEKSVSIDTIVAGIVKQTNGENL